MHSPYRVKDVLKRGSLDVITLSGVRVMKNEGSVACIYLVFLFCLLPY